MSSWSTTATIDTKNGAIGWRGTIALRMMKIDMIMRLKLQPTDVGCAASIALGAGARSSCAADLDHCG